MGSWLVFLALFLFTALATVAKAESPHDIQDNAELADTIINELRTGQFDLLESQYRDFADRDHQTLQSDGTPRIWIYFWAFERSTINSPRIEEAQTITQKIRGWLEAKPNSIPALLALDNALLGESENIRNRTIAQHRDLKDPQVDQQLQRRTDEITSTMKAVLFDQISALMAEPQYYSATMHLYLLEPVGYDRVQILDHDIQRCDPYYVPFYANAVVWLAKRRTHDPALPRPEIWLTDRLKPGLLDSDDDVKRKTEAYARTISITDPQAADLKVELLDWPALKAGLKNLIQDYGSQTNWPTRYLTDAYAIKDKEAAREALSIIQGNYSSEIIVHPDAFQNIAKWAEED